jgi:hypothetical protein
LCMTPPNLFTDYRCAETIFRSGEWLSFYWSWLWCWQTEPTCGGRRPNCGLLWFRTWLYQIQCKSICCVSFFSLRVHGLLSFGSWAYGM